jgi:hypothetical protein
MLVTFGLLGRGDAILNRLTPPAVVPPFIESPVVVLLAAGRRPGSCRQRFRFAPLRHAWKHDRCGKSQYLYLDSVSSFRMSPENQYPACLHVKEISTQPTPAPYRANSVQKCTQDGVRVWWLWKRSDRLKEEKS